jgi:hypothetical protein
MGVSFDIAEKSYEKNLRQHIVALLAESSKTKLSFHQIVSKSEGASPASVKLILDKITPGYFMDTQNYTNYNRKNSIMSNAAILSDPHPADYDWRFNHNTIERYLQDLSQFLEKKVALLGVKTIFPGLVNKNINATIFNKSSSLLNDFRNNGFENGLVECDLFKQQPEFHNSFHLVIADPPWYPEYYEAFICRGYEFLKIGGVLHVSVLKELTRPHADIDRKNIIINAQNMGFQLTEIIPDYFTYETPSFERNTLKVQNLYCEDWRKSDLFVFQKIKDIENIKKSITKKDRESWLEFNWNKKKVKIRKKASYNGDIFSYEPADPNGIVFTNVSRRSPYRDRIDLWTSDNLAFKVYKPQVIILFLESLSTGKSKDESILTLQSVFKLSSQEILTLIQLTETILNGSSN